MNRLTHSPGCVKAPTIWATLVVTKSDGKMYMQTDLEEHYVIVGEPGEFYLFHVKPETGTGLYIEQSIYKAVKDVERE